MIVQKDLLGLSTGAFWASRVCFMYFWMDRLTFPNIQLEKLTSDALCSEDVDGWLPFPGLN
jgi:hypothetical protein